MHFADEDYAAALEKRVQAIDQKLQDDWLEACVGAMPSYCSTDTRPAYRAVVAGCDTVTIFARARKLREALALREPVLLCKPLPQGSACCRTRWPVGEPSQSVAMAIDGVESDSHTETRQPRDSCPACPAARTEILASLRTNGSSFDSETAPTRSGPPGNAGTIDGQAVNRPAAGISLCERDRWQQQRIV